ncbi:MAG TPA: vitamin K epoxide reductase family protein [Fimbriimonadaceae bacterium]|nr:vitamin K epoxide reductase family protein [Fimbriimonadaceae bacterium]
MKSAAVWLNRILALLAWGGVFVAGVLTVAHFMGLAVPCTAERACDVVTSSKYSEVLGIPVAAFGLLTYLVLAGIAAIRLFRPDWRPRLIVTVAWVLSAVGTLASAYLQFVSFVELQAKCDWCLASAGIMFLTCLLYGFVASAEGPDKLDVPVGKIAFLAWMVLAIGGLGVMAKNMDALRKAPGRELASEASIETLAPNPAYSFGKGAAPVTIIEYADFYCPACRSSFQNIKGLYVQADGNLRLIYRNFPIFKKEGHEMSLAASIIGEFAATQGKYWPWIEGMFTKDVDDLKSIDALIALATEIGLKEDEVRKALSDDKYIDIVYEGIDTARRIGVDETPTYVIFADGLKPQMAAQANVNSVINSPGIAKYLKGKGGG